MRKKSEILPRSTARPLADEEAHPAKREIKPRSPFKKPLDVVYAGCIVALFGCMQKPPMKGAEGAEVKKW